MKARVSAAASGAAIAAAVVLANTLCPQVASTQPSSAEPDPGIAKALGQLPPGYLPRGGAPDSLILVPDAPAPGSPRQALDDASARSAQALRGTPRWDQAAQDANLKFPDAAGIFACAVGVEINPSSTPSLYRLLSKSMIDVALSTYPTKNKFQRARPFMATATPTCTPDEEALLRKDGSYPSGHSALGWGWALILAEAAPSRENAILSRGRSFGQSRVVCNVHWMSDVEEGRLMAAATVARLHDEAAFRADLAAARSEIEAARAAGRKPKRDCALEDSRLAAG